MTGDRWSEGSVSTGLVGTPEVVERRSADSPQSSAPTVPDLPCPKCGGSDVNIAYCDGCDLRPYSSTIRKYEDDYCSHGDSEHFHRRCRRCSYQWRTDDVLTPRRVCAK
jgi:hypothetical protein